MITFLFILTLVHAANISVNYTPTQTDIHTYKYIGEWKNKSSWKNKTTSGYAKMSLHS